MSDLKNIQQAAQAYRNSMTTAKRDLQIEQAKLNGLKRSFDRDSRAITEKELNQAQIEFEQNKKKLEDTIQQKTDYNKNIRHQYKDQFQAFIPNLNPVKAIEELSDSYPILLFPLRLEIRFKINNHQRQLWLRVYPDDCNIQHKETILSESELNNVKQFWIQIWNAGAVEKDERGAWRSLVNSHGSGRSAYLIKEYKPAQTPPVKADASHQFLIITSTLSLTNDEKTAANNYWIDYWLANKDATKIQQALNDLIAAVGSAKSDEINKQYIPENISDKVQTGMDKTKVFVYTLVLPDYVPKTSSWSEAPVAEALPDKFVVILTKGINKRTELFTNGVSDQLPVGPDPSLPNEDQVKKDALGNLIVNEELQWMVDFEKAVEVGMATKINLNATEYDNGFDSLKVIGIRFTSDMMQGKKELENLMTNHFYSKNGFGLLKQGTPTNNTEDLPSGYSWMDNPDDSYERIFKHRENFNEVNDLEKKSDGQKLADALGIDSSILKLVPNANGSDQLEANAINKALFPATMGYFMEEMMHPLFSDNDINHTKQFFSNYVSGRGPIPAIRIGKQPYGILPVSNYSRLNFSTGSTVLTNVSVGKNNYPENLYKLLKKMDAEWKTFIPSVPHVGQASGDPHQILLDVIGLHANSVEFHQRYSQTLKQLYNQISLTAGPFFGALIAAAIADRGKTILQSLGLDKELNLPILKKFFFGTPNLLKGPFVDDVPDSEITPVRAYATDGKNYIEWLASSTANNIRMENFGGNEAPTALLYLLLRHALMQAQSDAATRVLISNKVITDKTIYFDPDLLHVEENEKGKSKFEHLYNTYPTITGNDKTILAEHIYAPSILANRKETIRLNETLEALKVLEKVPTARLERLFTEHLDCCNYRLDAWFTALVQYKLDEQRALTKTDKNQSKGIYLGAYGLLLDVKPENKVLQNVALSPELTTIFKPNDGTTLQTDNTNLGYIHAPSLNQAATAAILRNAYDSNKSAGSGNPFAINLSSDRVRVAEIFLEGIRNGQSLSSLLGYHFERGLHDKHTLGKGEVDKFIYPLRKVFPLVANRLEDTKTGDDVSIEHTEARNVIDGLKLIEFIQKNGNFNYPFGIAPSKGLPPATLKEADAINKEVQAIIDIQDAIGDLVLSEQVYQTVLGNITRASGNADAFSKGNHPPDVEVMDTPRTGITLTHRMGIQLNATAVAVVGANPRSIAEPSLSEWLTSIFPSPQKVLCKVTYSAPSISETTVTISQQDLGIDAIDLFYMLQTDTEQGMTDLDDRIQNHVRYSISMHPDTTVFIQYTEGIDAADKTKISFFELSSLMNSLRKIIRSNRYLQPSHLALSQAGETVTAPMNDVLLKQRIISIRDGIQLKINDLIAEKTSIVSIASLTAAFKIAIAAQISDTSKVTTIVTQMEQDLKDYLKDHTIEIKNEKLSKLELAINSIGNAGIISTLKTQYGNALDAYVTDFSNLDTLISDVCSKLQQISLYQHQQTGTGFMHQIVRSIYTAVFNKCNEVITRWEEKKSAFETLMTGFNSAGIADEQFNLLKQAEQIISMQMTTPLPANFNDYKTNFIDPKKTAFDNLLLTLKSHATNNKTKLTDFIQDVETSLTTLSDFDPVKFGQNLQRNDLASEKLILAKLKEDIVIAIDNVTTTFNKAMTDCNTAIGEADGLVANTDKINTLLKSGKYLLGDDAIFIPQFTLDTETGNEFEKTYNAGINEDILLFSKNIDKRIMPVEDWLGGVARVKEKVHDWEHVCFTAEAFNSATNMNLVPLQFPYQTNDRWLALKFRDETDAADDFKINSDKLLYTSHFAVPFNKSNPQCGIIMDDWTEVIPNEKETTGIAFHYDQPNSEPSQTMLLLVPPEIKGHWQWMDVVGALDETLEMAKKRAIEPSKLEGSNFAQFLPTTMMAVTMNWITVASNLSMNNNLYQSVKNN